MLLCNDGEIQKRPHVCFETPKEPTHQTYRIVTDGLGSYGAALKLLGLKHLHDVGGRKNNRAECSHVPIRRRERKSQRFRSVRNAQKLLSAHGQIYNLFNHRRHLISRNTLRKFRSQANAEWDSVTAPICAQADFPKKVQTMLLT